MEGAWLTDMVTECETVEVSAEDEKKFGRCLPLVAASVYEQHGASGTSRRRVAWPIARRMARRPCGRATWPRRIAWRAASALVRSLSTAMAPEAAWRCHSAATARAGLGAKQGWKRCGATRR